MEEKRMFLVSEEDLRSIMNEMVRETIYEIMRTDRHGDMDDIMTVTDISELIGVDRRNLNGSQKYYLPFDRPEYRTKDGVRGWKRRDVLEHLARRDSDIRKSYEIFQLDSARDEYSKRADMYSAKASYRPESSDGANSCSASHHRR